MNILQIINNPITSNGYILYCENQSDCIIIDPGSKDVTRYFTFLNCNNLNPVYIFLTHEDFDHSWGANILREHYDCKIVCHFKAALRLLKPTNYFNLYYFNDNTCFSISDIECPIDDFPYVIRAMGNEFVLYYTPGHTDSSISIEIDDKLFSGDALLNKTKPLIKKRNGGSKKEYNETVIFLKKEFSLSKVYPGHGEIFKMREYSE